MRFKSILLILLAFFIGISTAHYFNRAPHQKTPQDTNYLFVQTASQGKLDAIPGQPGYYMLQLSQMYPYITAFTDRPARKAKLITMKQFLQDWNQGQDSFSKDAPNANLSLVKWVGDQLEAEDITLELVNKKFDATQNKITYTVHILGNETISTPLTFNYSALFVDGCCCINC